MENIFRFVDIVDIFSKRNMQIIQLNHFLHEKIMMMENHLSTYLYAAL